MILGSRNLLKNEEISVFIAHTLLNEKKTLKIRNGF